MWCSRMACLGRWPIVLLIGLNHSLTPRHVVARGKDVRRSRCRSYAVLHASLHHRNVTHRQSPRCHAVPLQLLVRTSHLPLAPSSLLTLSLTQVGHRHVHRHDHHHNAPKPRPKQLAQGDLQRMVSSWNHGYHLRRLPSGIYL